MSRSPMATHEARSDTEEAMTPVTHAQYLRSHTDFLLAEVFRPAEAPALAAQCLLPTADVLPAGRARQAPPQPWLTVEDLVRQVEQEHLPNSQIYEAWVADVVLALHRRLRLWPRLWQAPVRAYMAAAYAVRLDDPRALAGLAREEAIEALYGEEGLACYSPAAWGVWIDDDEPEERPGAKEAAAEEADKWGDIVAEGDDR